MSRRKSILMLWLLVSWPLQAAPNAEEEEIRAALMRSIVELVDVTFERWDHLRSRFEQGDGISHHYLAPARVLAWVYKTPDPMNPYHGDPRALKVAIEMGNIAADRNYQGRGGFEYHGEWPFYNLCQTYSLLEDDLPEAARRLWREYAEFYMETRGKRPMFYTAFNHEAGNVAAILRAGQVFGVAEWVGRARRLAHQLVKIQRELGYFDEGPQHGPSMRYNYVQLTNMLLYVDYSGDTSLLPACQKLADFMIRYALPDGSTIGAFDGRQSWGLGKIAYGLDRWPQGKELNRRVFRSMKKWGLLEPRSRYAFSTDMGQFWNGYWLVDELRSLQAEAPVELLPQDQDGYRVVESGPTFSGGVVRRHGWMVALSGVLSDIAHLSGSVYRMDRQSRIDVWHQEAGLIIGGGSNRVERGGDIPRANVLLLTGYRDVTADFGKLIGGSELDKRATFFPRAVDVSFMPDRQMLHESFGQGDVDFTLLPLDNRRLQIKYDYDLFSAKTLFIQLPLIAFYNSEVEVDSSPFDSAGPMLVSREVRISNPTTRTVVQVRPPAGVECALRPPGEPLRSYGTLREKQYHQPFYHIYLLSVRVDSPNERGSGKFELEVTAVE